MGGDRRKRHSYKEHLASLEAELRSDYGLSPIESRALVRRVADFVEQVHQENEGFEGLGPFGLSRWPTVNRLVGLFRNALACQCS